MRGLGDQAGAVRIVGTFAGAVKAQRVINANNVVALSLAQMQRRETVRAAVVHRDRRAVLLPVDEDRGVEDLAVEQALALHFPRQRSGVPGV